MRILFVCFCILRSISELLLAPNCCFTCLYAFYLDVISIALFVFPCLSKVVLFDLGIDFTFLSVHLHLMFEVSYLEGIC